MRAFPLQSKDERVSLPKRILPSFSLGIVDNTAMTVTTPWSTISVKFSDIDQQRIFATAYFKVCRRFFCCKNPSGNLEGNQFKSKFFSYKENI